jgi:histone deacetylase 1/2
LVARGFSQQEGIDYSETFGPVVKQATVILVFSIAVSCNWKIYQLDIHNAFLNGVLAEEVYMKQPRGFVDSALPSYVYRLHKSLYGLKQAPRAWYTRLSDFLLSVGFHAFKVDTFLFILSVGADIFYLLVYVDNILLTGSNSAVLHHLIQLLSSEFKLRDLGAVHYFLGIEVQSTALGLMLRQHKYILDILTQAGMTSC